MTTNCQICDDKFNKSTHLNIACMYCNFEACRTCCETYVLGEPIAKCMSPTCGREWTRKFISTSFTKVFINTKLKSHWEQLIFDRERALLPETQVLVQEINRKEALDERIRAVDIQIYRLNQERKQLIEEKYNRRRPPQVAATEGTRNIFIRACPDAECRGFLSTQWKCGLCQKWACPDCQEIKGLSRNDEHVCDPNTLATARLLSHDTKPCPKCRAGIYKIDGCDQMWCTQCHTAFSWRTGRIEERIHNPHYFEWLRRNGTAIPRNENDVPCAGNQLTNRTIVEITQLMSVKHKSQESSLLLKQITDTEQVIRHIQLYEIPHRRLARLNNEELRILYLRKKISEDDFKTRLQQKDKQYNKTQEVYNIYEIIVNTVSDILLRFLENLRNSRSNEYDYKILEEIDPILDYTRECFNDINKTYCSKIKYLSTQLKYFKTPPISGTVQITTTIVQETSVVQATTTGGTVSEFFRNILA